MVLEAKIQRSLRRDRPDSRQMVSSTKLSEDGSLSTWSPSAHYRGEGVEARFIGKEDALAFFFGLFLSSGHFCSLHSEICFSSPRCRARRRGFCRLQPITLRSRPT